MYCLHSYMRTCILTCIYNDISGNIDRGERVRFSSTFSSIDTNMSAAETCYRLLIGDLDVAARNENIDTDGNIYI
jgi:hypothetical protein